MSGIGNGIARGGAHRSKGVATRGTSAVMSVVMSAVMSWPDDRMQRSHSRESPTVTGPVPRDAGGENR
jgi:hypothetical protein